MADLVRGVSAVVLAVVLFACGSIVSTDASDDQIPKPISPEQKATAAPENPNAPTLAEFNARLEKYIKFQRTLLKEAPLRETENSAEITARQELLAAKIRTIRKNARQGDIFTPQVAAMFRRLLYPELHGTDAQATKDDLKEGAPTAVPVKVNAAYPADQPLSTVPANLLARLPHLPKDVDYRVVGRHLILRDVDANIIVDYIPNAIR
jgi:hypothetical protein